MNPTLLNLCKELELLDKSVIDSTTENRTANEISGWNLPAVSRHDLAEIPRALAQKIRETNAIKVQPNLENRLKGFPSKLKLLISNTVPQMFNGNGSQAIPAFISTLTALESLLQPIFEWQVLAENKALPPKLLNRLRSIQTDIDLIVPDKTALESRIQLIEDATEAADTLPQDLQRLSEARRDIAETLTTTGLHSLEIERIHSSSKEYLDEIKQQRETAAQLVEKCEEAYRITTTKGLQPLTSGLQA